MARPAPLSFTPPNPPFASSNNANNSDSSEPPSPTTAFAAASGSPPQTPRSLSFLTPPPTRELTNSVYPGAGNAYTPPATAANANPFSPPASVRSFSAVATPSGAETPNAHAHTGSGGGYPFPSPNSTRASSLVDVPRAFSSYSIGGAAYGEAPRGSFSRPGTGASASGSLRVPPSPTRAHSYAGNGGNTANGSIVEGGKPAKREAFASPPARPLTIYAAPSTARLRRDRPKSTALLVPTSAASSATDLGEEKKSKKGGVRPTLSTTLVKPWIGQSDPHARLAYWITYAVIFVGFAAGAARIYSGWTGVLLLKDNLCPVLLEDFSNATTASLFGSGIAGEGGTFFREVDASGFGNGEFEMTTASDSNSFVYNNRLYLVPTLTSDVIPESSILDGAVYNLTDCTYNITHSSGYTTSGHGAAGINTTEGTGGDGGIAPDAPLDLPAYLAACSAHSNATEGRILPPIMSARISTRKTASVKFGRVEVVAKLPTGDWLWPAIWMLPVDSEIDIMEARGNGPSYPKQGINYVRSSLNWGPATFLNAVAKTYGWWTQRRGRYDDDFHTYALEWNEDFIRMYVDSRLTHMFEMRMKKSFWEFGDFPTVVQNGTESVVLENPWVNGTKAAPFDQSFYLIMNVAVGGTNGWFPDGPEKPWLDGSGTAPLDFLRAKDQWYPTWPQDIAKRAMVVDSVKMWEKC
ncbi:concanavalin A-like lectin/glucanase domain-containing protein [Mycena capillaripes]|nr:concanavalin A-like lectin/glucanase domain-containing protein [Mycena capillaripes]